MATPKNKNKSRRIAGVAPACSRAAHELRVTKGDAPRSVRRRKGAARRTHTACPPSGSGARRQGESQATIRARAKAARIKYRVDVLGMSPAAARKSAARPLKPGQRIGGKKSKR